MKVQGSVDRRRLQRRIAGLLPPPARRLNISRGSEFARDVRGLVEEHAQASSLSAAAVWRAGLLAPGEVAVAGGGSGGGSFSWSGWRPPVFGDFLIHASSFNNAEATGTPLFQFKQSDPFSGVDAVFTPLSLFILMNHGRGVAARVEAGGGLLEAALDVLASSLPPTTASPATDDPLDGSRLIAETRALAAAYRRIIEEGSGEVLAVLAVSGPTATFAFVEELVADTYLARWDAFPREGLSFYAFNAAKTTLGRWLVTVYAETNRYPWAAAGQGQPTAGAGGGEGEESGGGLFHRPESLSSVVASLPLARRRAVEILGVYAEASGGQTPPVAAVPVLAFDAARLRLLEPSGALFYDYVYEALLWDQTYGVPDSVIDPGHRGQHHGVVPRHGLVEPGREQNRGHLLDGGWREGCPAPRRLLHTSGQGLHLCRHPGQEGLDARGGGGSRPPPPS